MNEGFVLFIISVILVTTIGYLAQRVGLCMVRGVEQAASGRPSFLLAILCSGAFAWVAMLLLQYTSMQAHFGAYQATFYSFAGGFLFGMGAAFNHGCGVSTIGRLVRGESIMLATVMGWFIGWLIFSDYAQGIPHIKLSFNLEHQVLILGAFSLIISVIVLRLNPANRVIWRDLLILGLMASIIFLYEPRWTPSGLLKDMGLSLWAEHMADWPSLNRFILMFCLMGGMLISTLKTGTFSLTFYSFSRYLFHLSAGILMGIGAVLAGGGNDSQLLIALPSLSPAGFSTIFSIIFGIYLGKRLIQFILSRRKRMLPE